MTTLKEYYQSLAYLKTPQATLRNQIKKKCGVTDKTVFRWLAEECLPKRENQQKIAEITGIPVEELFANPK